MENLYLWHTLQNPAQGMNGKSLSLALSGISGMKITNKEFG